MGYYEGPINDLGCNNNGGMFGNNGDWIWAFLLFALIGNGGWGGAGYGGGRGCYGSPATVQDVASGFSTSEIMSDLNDIILGQSQGFANVQQTLCQGFSGVNATVTNGFTNLNTNLASMAYNTQSGFNALSREIADCCCSTKQMLGEIRYDNAKNTCDIIRASQDNTRAILDYLTTEKISSLQSENAGLKAQISNDRQSQYIVSQLREPCPVPSYVVQPPQQVTFPTNCCGNVAYASYNNGCGCN